nr:hypothetical protein HK105_004920 [Polyrhizophydium stewartii]
MRASAPRRAAQGRLFSGIASQAAQNPEASAAQSLEWLFQSQACIARISASAERIADLVSQGLVSDAAEHTLRLVVQVARESGSLQAQRLLSSILDLCAQNRVSQQVMSDWLLRIAKAAAESLNLADCPSKRTDLASLSSFAAQQHACHAILQLCCNAWASTSTAKLGSPAKLLVDAFTTYCLQPQAQVDEAAAYAEAAMALSTSAERSTIIDRIYASYRGPRWTDLFVVALKYALCAGDSGAAKSVIDRLCSIQTSLFEEQLAEVIRGPQKEILADSLIQLVQDAPSSPHRAHTILNLINALAGQQLFECASHTFVRHISTISTSVDSATFRRSVTNHATYLARECDTTMLRRLLSEVVGASVRDFDKSQAVKSVVMAINSTAGPTAAFDELAAVAQRLRPQHLQPTCLALIRTLGEQQDEAGATSVFLWSLDMGITPDVRTFTSMLILFRTVRSFSRLPSLLESMQRLDVRPDDHFLTELIKLYWTARMRKKHHKLCEQLCNLYHLFSPAALNIALNNAISDGNLVLARRIWEAGGQFNHTWPTILQLKVHLPADWI